MKYTYDDLTEDEKHLCFVVLYDHDDPVPEGVIEFVGSSRKECEQWIQNNLLPMTVVDRMYGGAVVRTIEELHEFLTFHNTYCGYVDFKNKYMKEFSLEIVPETWYAYESSLIDHEEIFYEIAKEHTKGLW